MITLPVYPRGDLDESELLLNQLGSFWAEQFNGGAALLNQFTGRTALYEQTNGLFEETDGTISRYTVPVYRVGLNCPFILRQDQMTVVEGIETVYQFPLPENVHDIPALMNRLTEPSVTMLQGTELSINVAAKTLTLDRDPFQDPGIATRQVVTGSTTRLEALLFGYATQEDISLIHTHYGYVMGLDYTSSTEYRDFLNSVRDAHNAAPTELTTVRSLAAAWDTPVALSDETVDSIIEGRLELYIVTDKRVYKYNRSAVPLVAAGDAVRTGDQLVDTFIYVNGHGHRAVEGYDVTVDVDEDLRDTERYPSVLRQQTYLGDRTDVYARGGLTELISVQEDRGEPLTDSEILYLQRLERMPQVELDGKFLGLEYEGTLRFPNQWEQITNPTLDEDGNGLRFTVLGSAADVNQFWAEVERKGVADISLALWFWIAAGGDKSLIDAGSSSSSSLVSSDVSAVPVEATAKERAIDDCSNMDLTINPMLFIIWHVLGRNTAIVQRQEGVDGANALPSSAVDKIRDGMVPHAGFTQQATALTLSSSSSSSVPVP